MKLTGQDFMCIVVCYVLRDSIKKMGCNFYQSAVIAGGIRQGDVCPIRQGIDGEFEKDVLGYEVDPKYKGIIERLKEIDVKKL